MKRLRTAGIAVVLSAGLLGCPDKKAEAPKPIEKPAEAPKVVEAPKPAPVAVEERAPKECAAPIDPGPSTELKFGERAATLSGARLTFKDKDADGALVFGVLGPVNEDSGLNQLSLKKYAKFFVDEKADAIVVTGDVGEVASGITRVLDGLGATKLPVFVIIGNRECRAEFTDGVAAAKAKNPNLISMNEVRVVEFPELTLVSLPGYHDAEYITCKTGCQYFKGNVTEVVAAAKAAKTPVALIAHGPPHGSGNQALDFASGGNNVGDENITKAINDAKISFGMFSNIKEAGGRATKDPEGTQLVKEGEVSDTLFVNPGPADSFGWDMNDGTNSVGMAAVMTVKEGKASYKLLRLKPPTAAEKAEAKKLEPAQAKTP